MNQRVVPLPWRIATEVYIPKINEADPSNIKDFRPIALLNVGGNCFSVSSRSD